MEIEKSRIIKASFIFVFICFIQLNALGKSNELAINKSIEPYVQFGLTAYSIGALYAFSSAPSSLGGLLLVDYAFTGNGGAKKQTYILSASAYNFTVAQGKSREEVFLINLVIWGAIELFYPKEQKQSTENIKQNVQVMPVISPAGYQIGCNIPL